MKCLLNQLIPKILANWFKVDYHQHIMEKLACTILDFKDDRDGSILKEAFPHYSLIPDVIKTASMESPKEHEYALVLKNNNETYYKYAMHDPGNTVLSIIYLVKQANKLPLEAVKVASENLINAAGRFKLPIPEELKDLANSFKERGGDIRTREKYWKPLDTLQKVDELDVGRKVTKTASDGKQYIDAAKRIGARTIVGAGIGGLSGALTNTKDELHGAKRGAIAGGLTGALIGAMTDHIPVISPALAGHYSAKLSRNHNKVDVTNKEPTHQVTEKTAKYIIFDKYPIDTYDQVKLANAYFKEYWREFTPEQRHEYCVKLAKRMEDLNLELPSNVERYGSEKFAQDVDRYVNHRKNFVGEEFHPVLDMLLEKQAYVKPTTFAEALEEFDKVAGIDKYWDSKLTDPYKSTFGPTKLASDDWVYTDLGLHIEESDLSNLARRNIKIVKDQFGEEFAFKFMKSPKTTFLSLDKDTKVILARMATTDH